MCVCVGGGHSIGERVLLGAAVVVGGGIPHDVGGTMQLSLRSAQFAAGWRCGRSEGEDSWTKEGLKGLPCRCRLSCASDKGRQAMDG